MRGLGLSVRHEHAIRDGWILGFAVAPELAAAILPSRLALRDDPDYVSVLRGYDAIGREVGDPRLDSLAAVLARRRTLVSDLPGFGDASRGVIELLNGHVGLDSAAWRRLDELLNRRLSGETASE